jgi:hypothetical protein
MRRLMAKSLPALLLLPWLLASCLLPPFDRGLSLAQVTANKMKLEENIGPLYHWRGDLERGPHYFLPGKTFGLDRGFLLVFGASDGRVFYVDHDARSGYYIAGETSFGLKNSDQNIFNYGAFVLKDYAPAGYDALLLVRPSLLAEQRMECSYPTGTPFAFQVYDWTKYIDGIGSGTVIGAGLFPNNSTASDFLTLLVYDGSTYNDRISGYGFLSSGYDPTPWTGDTTAPAIRGSPTQGFYFRNPSSGLRLLSVWNGSRYKNYRWYDASTLTTLPFDSRIEALLTTDELFVVDGETGMVYSSAGKRKYAFPLGDLHLAYETYLGGVPTLIFSLIYWDRSGGGDEAFHIKVYSLPTASLSSLD